MNNKLLLAVNFTGNDKLSGSIKNIIGVGKSGGRVLRDMKGEARKLERELTDVRNEISNASGNITELVSKERQLEKAVANANTKLKSQYDNLKNISNAEKIRAKGEDFKRRGTDNIIAGGAILAPLILAVKHANDFQDGMIDIQQKSDLSAAAMLEMRNNILAASKASHQLPENLRAGVDTLVGAGLDGDLAVKLIGPIGKAATAFRAEVDDLAQTSFSNYQNLKVPIDQSAKALNIMVQAGKEGNFEINDMAQHFPALTAAAQTLGQKGIGAVSDLSAALQIARRGAGDSATAATNVQNLLSSINTERTIKKFEKFGIDLPAAMKKAEREGRTPLEAIALLTKQATGGDLSKIPLLVGSQQAQRALAPLINDFDDFIAIRERSLNAGNIIDKDFLLRSQSGGENTRKLMTSVSELALTLSTDFVPIVTIGVNKLTAFVQSISDWAKANPKTASTLLKIVAGIGLFKIGIGALQFAFGGLLGPVASIWKFFGKADVEGVTRLTKTFNFFKGVVGKAGPLIVRSFGMMRTAALFLGSGLMKAGAMMLANPIILLIAAIAIAVGGAAYLIYKHWDTISAAFSTAWTAIGGALTTGWAMLQNGFAIGINWLMTLPSRFMTFGKNIISGLVNGIMSAPAVVFNALKNIVMSGVTGVKSLLGIKSPSRVFMAIGGHVSDGMTMGIDKRGKRAVGAAKRLAAGVTGAAAISLANANAAQIQPRAQNNTSAQSSTAPITIKIYGAAGQDVNELADVVIKKMNRAKAIQQRSAFNDG